MKTNIYYFSGTGNSLYIAQQISEKMKGSKLYSIPKALARIKDFRSEVIGIVCPIYMYRIPHIVSELIGRIENAEYIFLVFAGAGELGFGNKETLKVFAANNLKTPSLFNLKMPSNYAPYGATPDDKQKELFSNINNRVNDIVNTVTNRKMVIESTATSFFRTHIFPGVLYRLGYSRIKMMDNNFTIDNSCNGCSICQKVCPVNNIVMKDNKPVWNNGCEQCYACLQWCPNQSIQAGKRTIGVKRYHNPNISMSDIIDSSPKREYE